MKTYPFNALVSRMKYICRWSLMHSARPETLSEHTAETAILAHTLCLIAKDLADKVSRSYRTGVSFNYCGNLLDFIGRNSRSDGTVCSQCGGRCYHGINSMIRIL